jgi:mRNA interferase MazF
MPYEFGAIVLVPFPFTDQSASKRRPAVVVSNRAYNARRLDVVVMAVIGWQSAGLLKPSAVKPVFATLEQRLLIRQLGFLAAADQTALRKAISETIG